MDDQHSQLLPPRRRVVDRADGDSLQADIEPKTIRLAPQLPVSRRRRVLVTIVWLAVLAAIIAGLVWYLPRDSEETPTRGRNFANMSVPVKLAPVEKGDMPVNLTALGTVTPLATVTVKTQINGQLTEVAFREGELVQKGQFLAQIDPRPYQVALEQAQGQLAKDQALLKNAALDLERYNTLVAQNSIARQVRDTQVSLVDQYRAALISDQAAVDAQKLNLTYARIVSPITGRVGLRQVDPGNYVQTSDPNGIVVVTQLQPISVIFTLPEDQLRQVLNRWSAGADLPVTLSDRTGTTELAKGRLDTIDNKIDTSTGTVKLRALFDNDPEILFPNQFVNVKLLVETLRDATIIPGAAIQRGAPGAFVYLVNPDDTVAVQVVKVGPGDGRRAAIEAGLEPGQRVVVDGADRLREGAKITLAGSESSETPRPRRGGRDGPGLRGRQ